VESSNVAEPITVDWQKLRERAGPYAPEAFEFIRQGLGHTVRMVHGEGAIRDPAPDENRHVSGQQLCLGLRDFAICQYGMLARTVLNRWGVRRTDDFGRIVFAMIDLQLMRKTDQDSMEDFRAVYDFGEAFDSVEAGASGRA
jgi:uncharacterized repeat protein (TIGR04138 family)